jgi:hypothetical protein
MAAPIVSVTVFGLLLIVPVAIIMVLGVFKLIAWAGNAMLGRTNTVQSGPGGLALWPIVAGAVPICLIVLSLFVVKARTVQSVQVNSSAMPMFGPAIHVDGPQTMIVQDGTVVASEQMSEARQEILQALQQHGGQIPIDLPVEPPAPRIKPSPEPPLNAVEPVTPVASVEEASSSDVVAVANDSTTKPAAEAPPATGSPAEQKAATNDTAGISSELTQAEVIPPADAAAETPEQRQARLTELAAHISPWIRSLLKETQPKDSAEPNDVAEAAESSDKQIVVFELAGPIRQKYALIPLTPAFDAALSPVTPFLANGSLESIAESLAAFLKQPTETAVEISDVASGKVDSTETPSTAPAVASAATTVALAETTGVDRVGAELRAGEQLPEALIGDITPEWVDHPAPHQFVVRSDAVFPGESTVTPLNKAINKVLREHLRLDEDSLTTSMRAQARLVKLEIDEKTSQACIVKTFERLQVVGNEVSDKQNMRLVYALVEIPESVRKAAVQTVQMSLQRDRVTGLAVIIGLAWLAICAASVVVRLWGRGGFFRKMIAIPILCLICIPLLLLAVGTGAATAGIPGSQMPRYPWADSSKPIRIQL